MYWCTCTCEKKMLIVIFVRLINFISLQITNKEREERKEELMNSGFNLTSDKVLNTDYFKVMFKINSHCCQGDTL